MHKLNSPRICLFNAAVFLVYIQFSFISSFIITLTTLFFTLNTCCWCCCCCLRFYIITFFSHFVESTKKINWKCWLLWQMGKIIVCVSMTLKRTKFRCKILHHTHARRDSCQFSTNQCIIWACHSFRMFQLFI